MASQDKLRKGCRQVHGTSCENVGTKFGETEVGGENWVRAQMVEYIDSQISNPIYA